MNVSISKSNGVAGLAGAITIILVWIVSQFGHVTIPPEVASAITTVVAFGASIVVQD